MRRGAQAPSVPPSEKVLLHTPASVNNDVFSYSVYGGYYVIQYRISYSLATSALATLAYPRGDDLLWKFHNLPLGVSTDMDMYTSHRISLLFAMMFRLLRYKLHYAVCFALHP